jgi:ABC-type transport system involved in multi-copper enzyme maturation permease subunit
MKTLIIARFTLQEVIRKRFFLTAAIAGVGFLGLYSFGFHLINQEWQNRRIPLTPDMLSFFSSQLVLAGLFLIHMLGILVAIATSASSISQEVEQGTIQVIATKPLSRWEIVVGKWGGFAAMLALYIMAMAWSIMAVAYFIAGYWPAQPFLPTLLMLLAALSFLSLSIMGSTFLPILANITMLLMLFGIAFFGGMVEQIGALLHSEAMVNVGIATSLLAPSDALWRLAAHTLQPNMSLNTSPFASVTEPSAWMILYAALYTLAALVVATRIFRLRDL